MKFYRECPKRGTEECINSQDECADALNDCFVEVGMTPVRELVERAENAYDIVKMDYGDGTGRDLGKAITAVRKLLGEE